ncbi:MAG: asparagine synthase (glutamine-hydrolyzing) [Gammaproteobacteria bacterium]|nr:asparagine synthase (glutamine-hydrolyzing) [Pseudomonadales bacterium]MCP5348466.1 asparagine synthase (glutamine-hydrolyzing) [Pseudomonadales bacterium]
MCGIAGIMHADPALKPDPQLLVNMAAIQQHRGPDGFGYKTLDNHGVGFSHARLSIIDLNENRARQPFLSEDSNLLLAHNGEFYDYQRIRARLTADEARFQTKSDSEIILHLYPRMGIEKTLEQLRGEFAFSLYDRHEQTLHLVRDRFGIKPLYWTQVNGKVIFGSELKVLFAHPEVTREFTAEGLFHQLMQTMVPGTTAFRNIHQVKPGHIVSITRSDGQLQIAEKKYWDLDFPTETDRAPMDESEAIERVREGLLDAVALRLEADVPVGSYLSGGIDSCAIIGLASACRQGPVKAFTIGFDNKDYDESPIARQMADRCGADQDIMMLSGNELYGHFEETIWHTERSIYNTLAVAKFLMSRHVNESRYKVVMTGEGSDELFGGYPAFRRDMFLHGLDSLDEKEKKQWHSLLDESNALFSGAMLAREQVDDPDLHFKVGFTPSCLQPWLACAELIPDLLCADIRESLKDYRPGEAIAATLDTSQLKGRHALDKAQYVWCKTMLEGQILTWGGDRVDMANSMEARPAFLDHHLAKLAVSLPPELRIKGRTEKYVLREAMKGILPEVLYKREKFAFMAPPAHTDPVKWDQMRNLSSRLLSDAAIERSGLLSVAGVRALFSRHEAETTSAAEQVQIDAVINHMLCVQIMHEKFIEQDIPALAAARAEQLKWAA